MRLKRIALLSLIVMVVGGLAYALSRVAVRPLTQSDSAETPRAVGAAVAQLQVEGLAAERWLAAKAAEASAREPYAVTTPEARGEAATGLADKISEAAATISISGLAQAASGPEAYGQISPSPRALAPMKSWSRSAFETTPAMSSISLTVAGSAAPRLSQSRTASCRR